MFCAKKYTPLRGSQENAGNLNPRIFSDLDGLMAYDNVDTANDRDLCLICLIEFIYF